MIAEVKTIANIKQQIKRVDTNEKARKINVAFKSSLKTAMKIVFTVIEAKDAAKGSRSF